MQKTKPLKPNCRTKMQSAEMCECKTQGFDSSAKLQSYGRNHNFCKNTIDETIILCGCATILAGMEKGDFASAGTSKPLDCVNPTVERKCYLSKFVGAKPKNLRGYMYQKTHAWEENNQKEYKKSKENKKSYSFHFRTQAVWGEDATEDTFMMEPRPASSIAGRNARMVKYMLLTLRSKEKSQSDSSHSRMLP